MGQNQLLLDFDGLSSGSIYLPDLADQGIGNDYLMKEASSGRQRSSFSTQRSGCLYNSLCILNEVNDCGY